MSYRNKAAVGASLVITSILAFMYRRRKESQTCKKGNYESLIGNTPLIYLKKLSNRIGNGKHIYVKMESLNPGGTGKDRAALYMLRDVEERGLLPPPIESKKDTSINTNLESSLIISDEDFDNSNDPILSTIKIAIQRSKTGGIVVEGTSGSTGISLSTLSAQRGHSVIIVMPDDQSKEKQTILKCLGAVLHVVPTAAISNPNAYVNVARKIAEVINSRYGNQVYNGKRIKAAFMNQFENEANYNAHIMTTGPEIWQQTSGKIDAFCMSSGTGGTISGVGNFLKSKKPSCQIVLVDPPGSALFNKVKYNIAYASEQKERGLKRHRYDTIAEGIGLDRITQNFAKGSDIFDDAIRVTDQEAVDMAHWLLKEEGLFIGSSSAMNIYGAIRVELDAKAVERPSNIVTVVCDGGQRHLTRFWNRHFIIDWGLQWPEDDVEAWKKRLPACLV